MHGTMVMDMKRRQIYRSCLFNFCSQKMDIIQLGKHSWIWYSFVCNMQVNGGGPTHVFRPRNSIPCPCAFWFCHLVFTILHVHGLLVPLASLPNFTFTLTKYKLGLFIYGKIGRHGDSLSIKEKTMRMFYVPTVKKYFKMSAWWFTKSSPKSP